LRGAEPGDLDLAVAELEEVDADSVGRAASDFLDTLLIGVPPITRLTGNLAFAQMPIGTEVLAGRAHRSNNRPVDKTVLRVGPDGIQVGERDGLRTIRRDEVEGLVKHPDGGRRVIARDGWNIDVEPTMWAGGTTAVRTLDAIVPPERHLPGDPRAPHQVPQPLPRGRLVWHRVRWQVDMVLNVLAVFALVFVIVTVVMNGPLFSLRNVFALTVVVAWVSRRLSG